MKSTKDIIRKVKKVEIRTKHLVDGLIQGTYHSIFKGRGIEFNEVREYAYGDDIRTIDWNVTARMNEPYVKEFIEERDMTVYIVFDVSGSGEFGREKAKNEAATELIASLMFGAARNNDRVGLALTTDTLERFIPARKGKRHVMKLISELLTYSPKSRGTDLATALRSFSKIIKKRSIIFIVSDFLTDDFSKPLRILGRKNDCIAIRIWDTREHNIPDVGYILLEDEETGEQVMVDTSDEDFRKEYAKIVHRDDHRLDLVFRRAGADVIVLSDDEDIEVPLKSFFRMRMRRVR